MHICNVSIYYYHRIGEIVYMSKCMLTCSSDKEKEDEHEKSARFQSWEHQPQQLPEVREEQQVQTSMSTRDVVKLHIEKKNERTAIRRNNVQGVAIPSSRRFSSLST